MHPLLKIWAVINALGLHTSLMNIHHDTFVKYIFEDGSISLDLKPTFILVRARGHGYGWLLNHLFIHFVSHIYFHLNIAFSFWFNLAFDI